MMEVDPAKWKASRAELNEEEIKSLASWMKYFSGKYPVVGLIPSAVPVGTK